LKSNNIWKERLFQVKRPRHRHGNRDPCYGSDRKAAESDTGGCWNVLEQNNAIIDQGAEDIRRRTPRANNTGKRIGRNCLILLFTVGRGRDGVLATCFLSPV